MKNNYEIIEDTAILKINKNIYSKKIIIQASYVKIENYYILIDEIENYYIIHLKFKDSKRNNKKELEEAVYEFFDELIESQSYIDQLERTSKIREIILERALLEQTIDDETMENIKE